MGAWAVTQGPASAGPQERLGLTPMDNRSPATHEPPTDPKSTRVRAHEDHTNHLVDGRIPQDNATAESPEETTPQTPRGTKPPTPTAEATHWQTPRTRLEPPAEAAGTRNKPVSTLCIPTLRNMIAKVRTGQTRGAHRIRTPRPKQEAPGNNHNR